MLKALLKKQMMELGAVYVQNKKTGKRRSKGATIGFIVLFAFCFIAIAVSFFGMSLLFADSYLGSDMNWLYFSMLGILAIFLGVIGGVFMTYSMLYQAKDNDFLLALPIPPRMILFTRMVSVFLIGAIFILAVMLPAMIVYWMRVPITFSSIVYPILLTILVSFFSLALSCILGFFVALIAAKVKSKAVISLIGMTLLFGVYYICYFRLNDLLTKASENAAGIAKGMQEKLFVFYKMGQAGAGNAAAFLIFSGITAVLFGAVYYLLSTSFTKIVTKNTGAKKVGFSNTLVKEKSIPKTLLSREFKHFLSSPAYMMNCGLGLLLLPVAAIIVITKAKDVTPMLAMFPPEIPLQNGFIPVLITVAVGFIVSMNMFTAPSVSLEGKNLWALRSLPVSTEAILNAKIKLHLYLNFLPVTFTAIAMVIVFRIPALEAVIMVLLCEVFIIFTSVVGLMMGLKHPLMDWTSETIAVKQSMSVLFAMLLNWAVVIVTGGLYFVVFKLLPGWAYLLSITLILAVLSWVVYRRVLTKGVMLFEEL